jgi:hypothetical protein
MIYFISGHLSLTDEEFEQFYVPLIYKGISEGSSFVVGDAAGADSMSQKYLHTKTNKVVVYHMFDSPRFNAGFETKGGFASDNSRDKAMTLASDGDIAYIRPGKEKSGTQRNIDRRKNVSKK